MPAGQPAWPQVLVTDIDTAHLFGLGCRLEAALQSDVVTTQRRRLAAPERDLCAEQKQILTQQAQAQYRRALRAITQDSSRRNHHRPDHKLVLDRIRHQVENARDTRQRLKLTFDAAIADGHRTDNPADYDTKLRPKLGKAPKRGRAQSQGNRAL
jgi:hypothetical protein